MASDDGTDAGRSGARPEERKTETTLTTRIRINIPGSRPIPPVVVRTPVGDTESTRDETPAADVRPAAAPAASGPAETPAEPAAQSEEKTSDWFAPRKPAAGKGSTGTGGPNEAGTPGGSGASTGGPGARPGGSGATGTTGTTGARSGGGRPGGVVGSMSVPGASRPGGTNGSGLPSATGGPVAPGHGGGTGSFDVTEALAAGPRGGGSRPGASSGESRRDDLPYFSGNGGQDGMGGSGAPGASGQDGFGGTAGPNGASGHGGPGGPSGFNGPGGHGGPSGPQGPAGPTSGPVTGDGPLVPPVGGPGEPFGHPSGPGGYGAPRSALADLDGPPPAGLGAGTAGRGPGGGLSDDTAILTPQKPAPEPGTPGYRTPDNVSGHTVTSGIPVIPGAGSSPFGPGSRSAGPAPHTAPKPEPAPAPKAAAKPKKKGRSKLVLLGVGVVLVAGGVYGAGLLMNHTDVPKGTTVLGVDIGGGTRDDAVKKLDETFGSRVNKPLKLAVSGRTVTLTPENAGLQFDFQATASAAAKSDYDPVSVISALFGQQRAVEPVMPVDEEKLQAALQQAGGGSGSVVEGGIRFESGKAVPVYGKAGKAIDAARSTQAIAQAYRTAVETGTATPVTVPATTQQPTVSNAEVDREMRQFAQPAMSGLVTVRTDAAHAVSFSPQRSIYKFLSVTPVNGKLVEHYDLAVLKRLYGGAFDGVKIARGNGSKTPVTPQDVASALGQALRGKTPAQRVVTMSTNPQ